MGPVCAQKERIYSLHFFLLGCFYKTEEVILVHVRSPSDYLFASEGLPSDFWWKLLLLLCPPLRRDAGARDLGFACTAESIMPMALSSASMPRDTLGFSWAGGTVSASMDDARKPSGNLCTLCFASVGGASRRRFGGPRAATCMVSAGALNEAWCCCCCRCCTISS